jgi:general stress protein YciG
MEDSNAIEAFMYRDEGLIREFLAQLEGGVFDEDTQTDRSEGRKGGGASAKAGPVSGHLERGSAQAEETERIVRQTGASEFERLYSRLESLDQGFQFLDNIDDVIWHQLGRGEIVELEANIRPTGLSKVAELFGTFEDLLPFAEAAGVERGELDAETMKVMQFIKQLAKLGSDESISVMRTSPPHQDSSSPAHCALINY